MMASKSVQCRGGRAGLILLCLGLLLPQIPGAEPIVQGTYARRAQAAYEQAQAQWQTATNAAPLAWQFARTCYNLAEFATNDESRASLAVQGIEACRKLIKEQPKSAPGHYWLGMNLGQLARTELLGALALVREMEVEFKTAWNLDPMVDHGGPARSLGLLYREAPGWPTSIGSKRKAREWLDRAAHTAPDFPENWLVLSESALQWDDASTAREKLLQLTRVWPAARTNFTGVAWEGDWADWSARRTAAEGKIAEAVRPVKSSRRAE